jgi:hypothetical protein
MVVCVVLQGKWLLSYDSARYDAKVAATVIGFLGVIIEKQTLANNVTPIQ